MENKFVGRSKEQKELIDRQSSNRNEFVAVYGRRRVGKTFLIKETLRDKIDFTFTGLYEGPLSVQLEYFYNELKKKTNLRNGKKLKGWSDAFRLLEEYLSSLPGDVVTVFLDELPWMDVPKSAFLAALSYFWNMWHSKKILKLYVCGSSTSWMLSKLIGDKGGLYGRTTQNIHLSPFSLKETKEYMTTVKGAFYSNSQILDIYMAVGGIPYYLDMFDTRLPIPTNIDNLFFADSAPLKLEYDFLFRTLFKASTSYKKIVELLANKRMGMTRDDIASSTGLEGGQLTEMLKNLRSCDFLRCYLSYGKQAKEKMYQLIDPFILFHSNFVKEDDGTNEHFWLLNQGKPSLNAWSGYAYETVIFNHVEPLKKALGILGVNANVCSWRCGPRVDADGTHWQGAQIDLLIDRDDKVINVVEIKHASGEFVITGDYYQKIFDRVENFKAATKTKKAIVSTFVTTYGVKRNSYSGIAAINITMDDLFN